MIKVEISGMTALEEKKLRLRITKEFEGTAYPSDVVVSVVNSFVFDEKEQSQPHFLLQVVLTNDLFDYSGDIERHLAALEMKFEVLKLRKIIHAKK